MSLFPIRLKPGGTITVHLRYNAHFPVWVHRRDHYVDPNAKKTLCYERILPYIPPFKKTEEELTRISESGQIFGGAPILMAARYLQNDFQRDDQFLDNLVGLRDDTHHYYTLTLPEDAPLGRYHFELEDRMNGQVFKSGTADTDFFYVEKLNLLDVETKEGISIAHIENPSPEPVLAKLCQIDPYSDQNLNPVVISLAPKTVSKISFEGVGFLMYRDDDEILRLNKHKEKTSLRNPVFQTLRKQECTLIFSNDPERKGAYELDGKSEAIWQMASGFVPRSLIRQEHNAGIYDEMLQMGLIQEID